MTAPSKAERKRWERTVLGFLRRGPVEEALIVVASAPAQSGGTC
jgi:hypothetical protein